MESAEDVKNRVSKDIKELESYLKGLNFKHDFRHNIGCSEYAVGDDARASLEDMGIADAERKLEFLSWGPDQKGVFRLLYEVNYWDGSIDVDAPGGPYFWDSDSHRQEIRPLIEASFDIRKRVYQDHLSTFIKSLANDLRIEKGSMPVEDEIPF